MSDFFSVKWELTGFCLKIRPEMRWFRRAEIDLTKQGVVSPDEASQAPI
jgi:hypothetical protein